MTNFRILNRALLTNCEQLGILMVSMEVYKEGYAKFFQRYQNRKTAEYFADFGAFFLRECISPRIAYQNALYFYTKGSNYHGILQQALR